ncbi:hypothetical protein [Caudoviricetes sp.]|nr:hypothetical protein [Caudoviricetes sp.]UOF79102.1 hypothetical protein [Caudoviricetes sp.]
MTKIVVVKGGRDYNNAQKVHDVLTKLNPDLVVHSGVSCGAEYLAKIWADMQGVDHESVDYNRKYPNATVVSFTTNKVTIQTVI